MKLLQTYSNIKTQIVPLSEANWLTILRKPLPERPLFKSNTDTLHFGQVVVQFLGIPFAEDDYYNDLYDLVYGKKACLQLLTNDIIIDNIDEQRIQLVINLLEQYHKGNLLIPNFVSLLYEKQMVIKSVIPSLQTKINETMIELLTEMFHKKSNQLTNRQLSILLNQLTLSLQLHVADHLDEVNSIQGMPKFLWYGNANEEARYLLYFLIKLGCDIVIFNPSGANVLQIDEETVQKVFNHQYLHRKTLEPFPTERRNRTATVAYRASREIEAMLNHEGSGLYKSWQLRDYTPSSLTYKTTYDEIFLIAKEKAMIRPHFEVKNHHVNIPVLFSKVQGVSKNRKEYWDRLHSLVLMKNSLLVKQFPFHTYVNKDFRFHFKSALDSKGNIQTEVMIRSRYWRYGHLSMGLQTGIAHAVKKICHRPQLKQIHRETEEDVKVFLFTQSMQIPTSILKLLQMFDFSQDIPKLILYHNGLSGGIARTDAALLLLLNQIGIDVVIYNPAGHRDIEKYVDESVYDVHLLEDVVFEQEWKQPSFFKKLFSGNFL